MPSKLARGKGERQLCVWCVELCLLMSAVVCSFSGCFTASVGLFSMLVVPEQA